MQELDRNLSALVSAGTFARYEQVIGILGLIGAVPGFAMLMLSESGAVHYVNAVVSVVGSVVLVIDGNQRLDALAAASTFGGTK